MRRSIYLPFGRITAAMRQNSVSGSCAVVSNHLSQHDFTAITATTALTMIKENLTSGFLRSAKPIG
jgi:hypothetical protein